MHNKDRRQLDEHMGEDVEHGPYCCMHHCIGENMGLVGNVNIFSQNWLDLIIGQWPCLHIDWLEYELLQMVGTHIPFSWGWIFTHLGSEKVEP